MVANSTGGIAEWYKTWTWSFYGSWVPHEGKWYQVGKMLLGKVIPGTGVTGEVTVSCTHAIEQQQGVQLGVDWAKIVADEKKMDSLTFARKFMASASEEFDLEYLVISEADHRSVLYSGKSLVFGIEPSGGKKPGARSR